MKKGSSSRPQGNKRRWATVVVVFLGIWILALAITGGFSFLMGEDPIPTGNVAVIPIKGLILGDGSGGIYEQTNSQEIVDLIEKASESPRIKAIVLEINSPGGSAVASDEITQALKKTDKPTVAWMREAAASGGYWIASGTDHIVANRMTITGSIGVIASYLEFGGLLDDYNVTYERMVAGKYKDMGTSWRELTDEERSLFQDKLDQMQDFFIDEVAANREMPREDIEEVATGLFYLGVEAKELGLVDELGGEEEVKRYLKDEHDIEAKFTPYEPERTLTDLLAGLTSEFSFSLGNGLGDAMTDRPDARPLVVG